MHRPQELLTANIPMQWIGPVKIQGPEVHEDVMIPLATFETPLWPSTARGATTCNHAGGISAVIIDERMTRSILLEAPSAVQAATALTQILQLRDAFVEVTSSSSRFAQFDNCHSQVVGNLIYLRLEFKTGDAAGHNMASLAAERILNFILERFTDLQYVSISGNYCSDKKVSAVNGILGRGKYVVAEVVIPAEITKRFLRTTPEKIVALNIKKNLIGNILSGGLRTGNAHFANMLLAFYLATGQDAANIIEGSQGITHAEVREGNLYFSVTLPNIIVGSIGNGKSLDFVEENLNRLGCRAEREPGANARRLSIIASAAVLCGELSLLAAQTVPGELMKSHLKLERKNHEGTKRA